MPTTELKKLHTFDMKDVVIKRMVDDGYQTLGVLTFDTGAELFVCKTLELGWHENKPDISCIPKGSYQCDWTKSPRLSALANDKYKAIKGVFPAEPIEIFTYEVQGVKGRSGIRFHSANMFHEIKGCIALGRANKDINSDGHLDIIHSGATMDKFNFLLQPESFILHVL